MQILTLDAESNGLGGQAFAVAVLRTGDDASVRARHVLRCPILRNYRLHPDTDGIDPWVVANVLPGLADQEETHGDYESMCTDLREWWEVGPAAERLTSASPPVVLAHVAWPVEARLLLDVFPDGASIMASAPFPLYDLSSLLLEAGYHDPRSASGYAIDHGLDVEAEAERLGLPATPHHPLYDDLVTDRVARHLLARPIALAAWHAPYAR